MKRLTTTSEEQIMNMKTTDDLENILYSDVSVALNKLTTSEIIQLGGGVVHSLSDTSAMFFTNDGIIISVDKAVNKQNCVHRDYLRHLINKVIDILLDEYRVVRQTLVDDSLLSPYSFCVQYARDRTQYLIEEISPFDIFSMLNLGMFRMNPGTNSVEKRTYTVLSSEIPLTSAAYDILEDFFNRAMDAGKKEIQVMIQKTTGSTAYQAYILKETFPEVIIKRIKRFYSSGTLYEQRNESRRKSYMKFTLVENLQENYDWIDSIPPKIIPEFLKKSQQFIVNRPHKRCFIDNDGNFISEGQRCSHFGIIEDICLLCSGFPERYIPNNVENEDDCPPTSSIVDTVQDYILETEGWIQCSYDNSMVLIYKKPNNKQYAALEDYINYISNLDSEFYFVVANNYKKFSLIENTPSDIIKKIKRFFVSGILEEVEDKTLSESIESMGYKMYISNSAYTIRDLLLNKPKPYRLLYDANIDMYMICDASQYIHYQMIENAVKQGYYLKAKNEDSEVQNVINNMNKYGDPSYYIDLGITGYYEKYDDAGKFTQMVEFPSYLLYMIYVPTGADEDDIEHAPEADGYDDETHYSFGTLYTRDAYMPDFFDSCELLKLLENANKRG